MSKDTMMETARKILADMKVKEAREVLVNEGMNVVEIHKSKHLLKGRQFIIIDRDGNLLTIGDKHILKAIAYDLGKKEKSSPYQPELLDSAVDHIINNSTRQAKGEDVDTPNEEHEAGKNRLVVPEPGTEWLHASSGSRYIVIGVSNLHASNKDGWPVTVFYRAEVNGSVWSRPLDNWNDRFRAAIYSTSDGSDE